MSDEFFPYENESEKIVISAGTLKEGDKINLHIEGAINTGKDTGTIALKDDVSSEETISDIESVPNKELNDNENNVIVHKCVTCYFKRLAGSLTVGNWAKTYIVDTCALENAPLPPERTCGFWMSDS